MSTSVVLPLTFQTRPFSDYLLRKCVVDPAVNRRHLLLNRHANHSPGRSRVSMYLDRKPCSHVNNDMHLTRREVPLCTPDELLNIILQPTGRFDLPSDPVNEVYPGIFLSDAATAMCTGLLRRMGITHVLNAAHGKGRNSGLVNTWPAFYGSSGIQFLGVPAFDNIVFRIHPYFEEAADFIDKALRDGGKVLVHCQCGISRSTTLVCAFLMLKRGMSVQEAIRAVRKNRAVIPNDGFLQQLCDLNDRLFKNGRS